MPSNRCFFGVSSILIIITQNTEFVNSAARGDGSNGKILKSDEESPRISDRQKQNFLPKHLFNRTPL